ncbi:DUF2306 domain-containing protein [Streptomyces sp. YS-3]|uniref:DUF2306 domain-containing protein n=1 Tax=Streptomyces sp. YS-3 TaxID=3381352 RepID=UPI0038629254
MANVLIAAHAVGASLALILGGWQLVASAKGAQLHRLLGRIWVVDMYWTALSSFFITDLHPGHFTAIHGLSALTLVTLTAAMWAALRHRIGLHRWLMTTTYFGLVGAFAGAVSASRRDLPQLAAHRPLTLAAATAAVLITAAAVIALCKRRTVPAHHRTPQRSHHEDTRLPR